VDSLPIVLVNWRWRRNLVPASYWRWSQSDGGEPRE
jgi:hypothetical protein